VEKRFQKVLFEIVLDGDQEIFKDVQSYDIDTKNLSEALQAQVYIHVCIYIHICIYICMYVYMYLYIYIHIYIHIHIHIYAYIYISINK
jgi:hypothetical protein